MLLDVGEHSCCEFRVVPGVASEILHCVQDDRGECGRCFPSCRLTQVELCSLGQNIMSPSNCRLDVENSYKRLLTPIVVAAILKPLRDGRFAGSFGETETRMVLTDRTGFLFKLLLCLHPLLSLCTSLWPLDFRPSPASPSIWHALCTQVLRPDT